PAAGCAPVTRHVERIAVAGGDVVEFEVEETAWGPIVEPLDDGRALSLRWVAHLPGSINLGLAELAAAGNLDEALAAADRTAIPTQNLVIGDRSGRIAWRLLGPLPVRDAGCPFQLPAAGSAGFPSLPADPEPPGVDGHSRCAPWTIATDRSPAIVDPPDHRLWTANARVVDGEALALVGDGGYALGARQQQIRDLLLARDTFTEQDLL